MRDRQTAAAVFLRPAQTGQTGGRQVLVPRAPFLERLVLAIGPAKPLELGEFADQVIGQPLPDLVPELLDLLQPCRLTYQAHALLEEHR